MKALLSLVLVCGVAVAQKTSDLELARRLSDGSTRQSAIAEILASRDSKIRLLLSWIRKPPSQINTWELDVGLMDAFGELKSKEAIPFLIKNIRRERYTIESPNIFMKTTEVIESRIPAVAALIKIGPDALPALYHSYSVAMPDDRLAIIIVVSRIASSLKDASIPMQFLSSVAGRANMEHFRAEEGLKHLKVPAEGK